MRLKKTPVLNAANALTVVRIVLIPVFVALVVASEMTDPWLRVASGIAFSVASITDYVDGWVARRFELVTSFGKVADPIADKALTGSALVLLSAYGVLPWWITLVILVREWGITLMRFSMLKYGVIAASRGGKLEDGSSNRCHSLVPVSVPVAVVGYRACAHVRGADRDGGYRNRLRASPPTGSAGIRSDRRISGTARVAACRALG